MPKVWKQVLAPGTYCIRGKPVKFTTDDMLHFTEQGKEMLRSGLPIRVPLEHQDWADPYDDDERKAKAVLYNKGFVSDYRVDSDESLWAELDVPDDEFAKRLNTEIRFVSPRILPEFVDGSGRRWENVIAHVALTPQPVWHKQSPFGAKMKPMAALAMSMDEFVEVPDNDEDGAIVAGPIDFSLQDMIQKDDAGEWVSVDMAWKREPGPRSKNRWVDEDNPKKVKYSKVDPNKKSGTRLAKKWAALGSMTPKGKASRMPRTSRKELPAEHIESPTTKAAETTAVNPATPFIDPINVEARQASREFNEPGMDDLPVMPTRPDTGYTKELHKLAVPEIAMISHAYNLNSYREMNLSDRSLSNARGIYTTWTNAANGNTKKLVDKIGLAAEADATRMKNGHTHTKAGQPYAARMLAYRHMLDWAEQDHEVHEREIEKEKNEVIASYGGDKSRAAVALDYKLSLKEQPLAERLAKIGDRKQLINKVEKSGIEFFTNDVIKDLLGKNAVGEDISLDDQEKYKALLGGGKWEEVERKKNPRTNKMELKVIRTVHFPDYSDVKSRGAFARSLYSKVLFSLKHGSVPVSEIHDSLMKLSSANRGTLSPEEFLSEIKAKEKRSIEMASIDMAWVLDKSRTGSAKVTDPGKKPLYGNAAINAYNKQQAAAKSGRKNVAGKARVAAKTKTAAKLLGRKPAAGKAKVADKKSNAAPNMAETLPVSDIYKIAAEGKKKSTGKIGKLSDQLAISKASTKHYRAAKKHEKTRDELAKAKKEHRKSYYNLRYASSSSANPKHIANRKEQLRAAVVHMNRVKAQHVANEKELASSRKLYNAAGLKLKKKNSDFEFQELSFGDTIMPKKPINMADDTLAAPVDETPPAENEDLFDEGEGMEEEGGNLDDIRSMLEDCGIKVPEDTTEENFLDNLYAALVAYKHALEHHGISDGDEDEEGIDEGDMDEGGAPIATEEPMNVSMSLANRRLERVERIAASATLKNKLAEVDTVARSGMVPRADVDRWKKTLTAKQMALINGEDPEVRKVIHELNFARKLVREGAGNPLLESRTADMSHAGMEGTPNWYFDEDKGEEKAKAQKAVLDNMLAIANRNSVPAK